MIRKVILFTGLIFFAQILSAQNLSFEHYLGTKSDQSAVYFQQTNDGYVIVGSSIDSLYHTRGYYILKTDLLGNKIWDRNYSDAFSSYAAGMTILANGNIAIIGTHASINYSALAEVVLLDSAGIFLNSVTYPPFDGWGTSGVGIESTSDSALVITMYTDGFISTNYYSIFRLNADLSTRWTEFISYDGSLLNCHSLARTLHEGYFSLAYYDYYYYSPDPIYKASYIRHFDSTGTVLLDSLYLFDVAMSSLVSLSDGKAMIAGTQDSTGQKDMVLMVVDTTGDLLWQKEYGSFFDEESVCAIQTYDGGYVILANTPDLTLPGQHDLLLMKTNANGDSLWSTRFGSVLNETAVHLEQTPDSGFAILGMSSAFPENKIYFLKTDSLGVLITAYGINNPGRYFCATDSATFFLSPAPPLFTQTVWCTGDTTPSLTIDTTGVYYANVIDTAGNVIESAKFSVYFAQIPAVSIGIDTMGICWGAQLLNSIPEDLTYASHWYLNDSLLADAHSLSLTPIDTGHYKLVISNYCGADSDMVFIDTLYQLPEIPVITSPEVPYVCEFDSLRLSVTLEQGCFSQWYYADDFDSYPIPGALDSVFYATFQGVYLVAVTDSFGCAALSDPKSVSYDEVPGNVNSTGPSSFCQGGEIELYVPSGSSYRWSTGDTLQSIVVTAAGDYFVTFTDVNGCPKVSDTLTITILANPVISIGPDTTVCNTIIFTFEAPPGFNNYLWHDGSNDIIYDAFVLGNIADTQRVFVFVTDTNGCTTGDTAQIIFDICDHVADIKTDQVSIFPNPVRSGASIHIHSGLPASELSVYDVFGRLLVCKKFDFLLDFENALPPATYIFDISSGIERRKIKLLVE